MKINSNKIKSLFLLSLVSLGSAKEEKSANQTEIAYSDGASLNSLPQLATNLTDAKIAQESSKQNVYVAGTPVLFGADALNGIVRNKCTGSFVFVNTNSSKCSASTNDYGNVNDYGGFITSVFCYPSEHSSSLPVTSWDGSVFFGEDYYGGPVDNIDFNYVSNISNHVAVNLKLTPFVPKTTDEGTTDLLPVISSSNPTAPGLPVCVYGAASGYRCGNLIAISLSLTVPDLWTESRTWTFNGLGKVDLGTNGLLKEDIGAPVYSETQIGDRTLAQALGYISVIDNNDVQHQSFYYTPIEQALTGIKNVFDCTYSLLTYNETNSQEYDQLLVQVEIPAKK